MEKGVENTMFFTYLSVSISSLVKSIAIKTNNFFRNLHAGSMVPDLSCFALFLAHDQESVKKKIFVFVLWNKDS